MARINPRISGTRRTDKVAIIGMDGTTWHLLDPWVELGELKNF